MTHALVTGPDPDLRRLECTCGQLVEGPNAVDQIIHHITEANQ